MRGVNKLVLEVKSDGKYFDKALLFLKPERINTAQKEISDGAEKLLNEISSREDKKRRKLPVIYAVLGGLTGIISTLLSLFLTGSLSF